MTERLSVRLYCNNCDIFLCIPYVVANVQQQKIGIKFEMYQFIKIFFISCLLANCKH